MKKDKYLFMATKEWFGKENFDFREYMNVRKTGLAGNQCFVKKMNLIEVKVTDDEQRNHPCDKTGTVYQV